MTQSLVDLLVVSGTPAGCAAAIAAARRSKSVLILEPTQHLGGLTSSGIGVADVGSLHSIGGIMHDFRMRVQEYYERQPADPAQSPSSQFTRYWEAHVAARIWREMVEEFPQISVEWGAVAVGVEMAGNRIAAVLWERTDHPMGNLPEEPGEQFSSRGRVVIDCTYEGDIAAWAGVPWRIGREARSRGEPHAGIIYTTYMAREPLYGYLPQSILPGSTGEASDLVMAATYRMICKRYEDPSPDAAHRMPEPTGYKTENYAWLYEDRPNPRKLPGTRNPGGKSDLNVDFYGDDHASTDIVLAHPRQRPALRQKFIDHGLGFIHYLQAELGITDVGLADDEFVDNGNRPYQVYIREGRRIEGMATITEVNTNPFLQGSGYRPPPLADSVAVGDFEMDSKVCQARKDPAMPPEGRLFLRGVKTPFQVPYGVMVPQAVDDLLVPVAVSATHVAFSVVRMEPVWTALGHAAGIAAALMLDRECSAAEVPVELLQRELIAEGARPSYFSDVPMEHPCFTAIHWVALRGWVPHDRELRFRPDDAITWAELAEAVVVVLDLPISVTSPHFRDVPIEHPAFRAIETLYDLSTRTAVDVIPGVRNPQLDSFFELHRADNVVSWLLSYHPDDDVSAPQIDRFFTALGAALTIDFRLSQTPDLLDALSSLQNKSVTRGQICTILQTLAQRLNITHEE
ncbi:MAG: FAD-dependent oxidoreductase [Caldilineaceae bacterium]|nr:FAD-dependent oxidoreductase [Caldilineaceae bacterium]